VNRHSHPRNYSRIVRIISMVKWSSVYTEPERPALKISVIQLKFSGTVPGVPPARLPGDSKVIGDGKSGKSIAICLVVEIPYLIGNWVPPACPVFNI